MVDHQLDGSVALVTGGASGIGAATCRLLARSRATVAVADLDHDAARSLAQSLVDEGFDAFGLHVDVTDEAGVDAMVIQVVAHAGRLDIAVNSAGVGAEWSAVADTPSERWRHVQAVNLDGAFFCLRAEVRAMRLCGGGSVVNVASSLSQVARGGSSPYVTSKHGLLGLTRTAALDHADDGIRVNAVGPGFIDTPLLRARHDAASIAVLESLHPLGRLGSAAEVAEAIVWLASPAASFVTGTILAVDGGYIVP
ncbi:MAG: oxidoreductase [Frankiales bacterium]|nr:oxidoreductase [Frankiales bacterium]